MWEDIVRATQSWSDDGITGLWTSVIQGTSEKMAVMELGAAYQQIQRLKNPVKALKDAGEDEDDRFIDWLKEKMPQSQAASSSSHLGEEKQGSKEVIAPQQQQTHDYPQQQQQQ